jgi:hypothetical protein
MANRLRLVLIGAALCGTAPAGAADPPREPKAVELAQSAYYVYCAGGKIEVDGRSPEQMRSARGSDVCVLSRFGYLSDAQSFAQKNFGGPGKKCSCR